MADKNKKKVEKNIAHVGALVRAFRNLEKDANLLMGEKELDEDKSNKLVVLIATLKSKLEHIRNIEEQNIDLLDANELEQAIQESTVFEISANEVILRVENFINKNITRNCTDVESVKSSNTSTSHSSVKLPKLHINKFHEDILNWSAFYDSFVAAVHNSNISNVEKFNYLRGYLEGQALKTIEGLTLTHENYEKALALLEQRFGKKELIISKHMNDLLKLEPVLSDSDIPGLRIFHDSVESHVRSLLSLNIDSKSYGTLLTPIIMEKLPLQVRLILGRDLQGEGWDLTKLLCTLKTELSVRESCVNSSKYSNPTCGENFNENKYTASALLANHSKIKCAFCKESHYSDKCTNVTDAEMRKNILQKSAKCFKCLKPGHVNRNCNIKKSCYYCNENHNSSLCRNRVKNNKETFLN